MWRQEMWVQAGCLLVSVLLHTSTSVQADREPTRNVTGIAGERLDLPCDAVGEPKSKFHWFYQNSTLANKGSNYRILRHGILRFQPLHADDTGFYACSATEDGRVRSPTIHLNVEAPVMIDDGPEDRKVFWGTVIRLPCTAYGLPQPYVQWKRNNVFVIDEDTQKIYSKPYLLVNITESAIFTCIAENRMRNGSARKQMSARISVAEENKNNGICVPYNGTVCQKYIGKRSIFVSSSLATPGVDLDRMVGILLENMTGQLSPQCHKPAEKLICHYAFPACDSSTRFPRPTPICRENCMAVRDLFCKSEWNSIVARSSEGLRLPKCQTMPSSHNTSKSCTYLDLFGVTPKVTTSSCYNDDGRFYIGTINTTYSGLACQHWSSQFPHNHSRKPEVYPILTNSSNYCRNAGGERDWPWCYTLDSRIEWQYCTVPRCDGEDITTQSNLSSSSVFDSQTIIIITAVSAVSLSLLVLISVLCYRMCDHRQHIKYSATPQCDFEIDISKLPANVCYHQRPQIVPLHPKLESLEYPRNDVVYMRDIGQGAFGRVFQAKAPDLVKEQEWTVVAVKMLKDDATEDMQRDFEREASLMVGFNHPNIVRLLGVCAIGRPICLLFEYMSGGDLNDFLRNCSPEHFIVRRRSTEVLTGDEPKLDHIEQLDIAKQIAAGMVYLSEKGYVHRDLATRNCLVGENLKVKISDFGLTRCLHNGEYFQGSEHDAIPIRWMPLEAILYNKFTSESDVWSFGVVLWEIFSFALQPYYGMVHEEVVKYVREGRVLLCPDNTPQNIYELMRRCWSRRPSHRPPFQILLNAIISLQEEFIKRKKRPEKA